MPVLWMNFFPKFWFRLFSSFFFFAPIAPFEIYQNMLNGSYPPSLEETNAYMSLMQNYWATHNYGFTI